MSGSVTLSWAITGLRPGEPLVLEPGTPRAWTVRVIAVKGTEITVGRWRWRDAARWMFRQAWRDVRASAESALVWIAERPALAPVLRDAQGPQ